MSLMPVFPAYNFRLAPEYPFPTWINDAWDATKYFAENAASYHASPSKGFIVGGSSAGGNIAAVLAHLSRLEMLEPPITGQYLSVPTLFPDPFVNLRSEYHAEFISHNNSNDPVLKSKTETDTKRTDLRLFFAVYEKANFLQAIWLSLVQTQSHICTMF